MPSAVAVAVRKRLFELADQGLGSSDIADRLQLVPRTVRRLLAQRDQLQAAGYQPAYHRCGRKADICQQAIEQRRDHSTWGAPYIRVVLQESASMPLPSTRTLQRHLRQAGLQPAKAGRRPSQSRRRACVPHEVWQMDACEAVPLCDQREVSWLRLVDECSGAFLGARVFPPRFLPTGAGAANARLPA